MCGKNFHHKICVLINRSKFLITVHQRSCGKVMFLQVCVSVCLSTLDLTVQVPPAAIPLDIRHSKPPVPSPPPPDIRHGTPPALALLLLVTSGGHHWRTVQTCSFEDHPVGTDIWWLKHIRVSKWLVRILLECFLVLTLSPQIEVQIQDFAKG